MSETKNDIAWNKLFLKYKISEEVLKNGSFEINASQINEFREARLMTKFDFRSQLPEIFSENKLLLIFFSFVKSINSYSGSLAFLYLFKIR